MPPENDTQTKTQHQLPVVRQLAILGAVLVVLLGSGTLAAIIPEKPSTPAAAESAHTKQTNDLSTTTTDTTPAPEDPQTPFANISIGAQHAFVWDVQKQRVLYEKQPDESVPIASITKLMTALVAEELVTRDTTISITDDAVRQAGDSGLRAGETFSVAELIDLTLMSSSNDGAYALAAAVGELIATEDAANTFVQAMNIKAEELELTKTYFRNPTGLDISDTEGGAYSSARDVAFLMEYILQNAPVILERTREPYRRITNTDGAYHESENTNPIVDEIPGIIGSKTGYTDLAGGNLVVAFSAGFNRPIIVAVLNSSWNGRFSDVARLAAAAERAVVQ